MTQKITYLYRDAGNFKFWGEFFVDAPLDLRGVKKYLFDEEFFVPEKVGLQSLVPDIRNDDDHSLHEFYSEEECEIVANEVKVNDLLARLCDASINGWF